MHGDGMADGTPGAEPSLAHDHDAAPLVIETLTALACAMPLLYPLFAATRAICVQSGLLLVVALFELVGWPALFALPFSEVISAATTAVVMTCLKWLLVGRLRASTTSSGSQRLVLLRWRIGRLIHKELHSTCELLRGTILLNYLLRALGASIHLAAVVETTGVN